VGPQKSQKVFGNSVESQPGLNPKNETWSERPYPETLALSRNSLEDFEAVVGGCA
jgi:hypothetical protein